MYTCPVCKYDQLDEPPEHHNICCCCGTQFGLEDKSYTYKQIRGFWIEEGCPWFSTFSLKPLDWVIDKQEGVGHWRK